MVIPRKKPEELMNVDLRTPVTRVQKETIQQAAGLAGLGLAPWCRQALLKAAKVEISKESVKNTRSTS